MGSSIKQIFPNRVKHAIKIPLAYLEEMLDRFKHRSSMVPNKSRIFVGAGDFEAIGLEFRKYFIELAGLQPTHRVLDVGCGIGRMAIPLTNYLSASGPGDDKDDVSYCGFDIVRDGVEWCQKRITPRFRNFQFRHSDVFNKYYNANGMHQACQYKFPYGSEYFDTCFLTSVFTHMLPADLENYVGEISRVLKVDGVCLFTFFILNEESIVEKAASISVTC